jgi:hypothetical protein
VTAVAQVNGAAALVLELPAQELQFRNTRTIGEFRDDPVTDPPMTDEQVGAI